MLGGASCCNSGGAVGAVGAKKRAAGKAVAGAGKAVGKAAKKPVRKPASKAVGKAVRKPKARKGGNAGNPEDDTSEPALQTEMQEPTEPVEQAEQTEYTEGTEQQSGGAGKKKGSKVVAKRALSPYNKFVKKQFAILKMKFPDEKAPQIMQKIAIEWKKTKK